MKALYKISYMWYDCDRDEKYVGTDLNQKEFENLLREGVNMVNSLPTTNFQFDENDSNEKVFRVRCTPEAFRYLVLWLEEKGCQLYSVYTMADYELDDFGVEPRFYINRVSTTVLMEDIMEGVDGEDSKE